MSPPTATAATKVNGNSIANASWFEVLCTFWGAGLGDSVLSGLESKGIVREPREGFRIQPGGERDKHGYTERYGLRVGHQRPRRFTGLLEPGMHDDAEVVVERRNDVENCEHREHGMLRFDEREEDEILAHEARGRRDSRKRKHEDQQQERRGGAALVEAIQIIEFLPDQAFLAKHDDHSERPRRHEHIGKQIVSDAYQTCFIP